MPRQAPKPVGDNNFLKRYQDTNIQQTSSNNQAVPEISYVKELLNLIGREPFVAITQEPDLT